MSGRTSVLLPDGRFVRGYRKTLRQQARRTPAHKLPNWRLSFVVPDVIGFALAPGAIPGVIGSMVGEGGFVEISGKNRDWVCAQAALGWSKLCRPHLQRAIDAVLERADEPGPTVSGPIRKGVKITCRLEFDGHTTVLVSGLSMRRISYPVPVR